MKIWIDLFAAPDAFFFRPIIKRLKLLGHQIWITCRDYCEAVDAAQHCGFDFQIVGRHGGELLLDKITCTCSRVFNLTGFAIKLNPDVAVSFNSYSQAITARILGIEFITFMDYEYHPLNHLAFRLANEVILPTGYDIETLSKQTGKGKKVHGYKGLKEDISTIPFTPDKEFWKKLDLMGVSSSNVLVTMRPPPKSSCYHRFDNDLFYDLVYFVATQPNLKIIYLPRSKSQLERVKAFRLDNIITPPTFLDGYQLIYSSDLVISAGGSMNREAVTLETPAYTVFKGKMAGVDKRLIENGSITEIKSRCEFGNIVLDKCPNKPCVFGNVALLNQFTEIICGSASSGAPPHL